MPIMQTHCVRCSQCDWKAVWRGGDVVMLPRHTCPVCGGDIKSSVAMPLDRLNPVYRLNYFRLFSSADEKP